jgi:heavy metal sensor kinase
MTLTSRFTTYFLAVLATVLISFSVALYLLAHVYLDRQCDDRLEAALDTLAAAVDVSEGYLEWEGHDRHLTLGRDDGPDHVRWMIRTGDGRLVAKSDNLASARSGTETDPGEWRLGPSWRMSERILHAQITSRSGGSSQRGEQHGHAEPEKHSQLHMTAAVSTHARDAHLRQLALALVGLSATVLLTAALAGRWLCRRALAPVTAMAGAARDMTAADLSARLPSSGTQDELADLEHTFNDLLARLQEAFECQRRFTGDASHQLRTPLAAMLGQVEVALRRDRSGVEYREVLTRVFGQGQHLQQIIEALLFLARADADTQIPEKQVIDIAAWLPTHLQNWHDNPRWPDMSLELESCPVLVHPALLGQLIDNLLSNACKYSEAGTPIVLRVRHDDDQITLSVTDAGTGIASEDRPHLFEPFFRSQQARRDGKAGSGLGLAIAKRIAVAIGACLEVDDSTQFGSRFVVRFPALPPGAIPTQRA